MPTYDYECSECKDKFEVFQKMTDKLLKNCPSCGGRVKRLIGRGVGLIFKGSGFYQTDYKNKNTAKPKKTDAPSPCSGCDNSSCNQANKKEK